MEELVAPKNRRYAVYALCLWLTATLACSSSQETSPESRPTTAPVQSPVMATPPAETPAQATPPSPTGRVYYVAANEPDASDSNNGLRSTYQGGQDGPWLTIQHAAATMTAGDTSYVRAGTYYESSISFVHSGAPDAPITLSNYQSEKVVIDGSQATDDYPGIWIGAGLGHYVIQGLTVRNMPWSGIATNESATESYPDITIRDCTLHDNGWSGIDLAAADGFVVENVEAYNITFERNFSYDNGVAGFAINSDSHHVVYRNNVAWQNGADWAGQGASSGFLCYEGCWHVEFYNNVSVGNTE